MVDPIVTQPIPSSNELASFEHTQYIPCATIHKNNINEGYTILNTSFKIIPISIDDIYPHHRQFGDRSQNKLIQEVDKNDAQFQDIFQHICPHEQLNYFPNKSSLRRSHSCGYSLLNNKASQTRLPCQQIRCCTSTYYVHTLNTQKIYFNLNSLNTFTKKTSSPSVKPILIR